MPPAALIASTAMRCTEPALLSGIGERAGDRVQHADLHRITLCAQDRRHRESSALPSPRHRARSMREICGG